jgi:hypothetical protein
MKKFASAVLILFACATVLVASDLKTYKATYEREIEYIVLGHGMEISQLGQSYTKALDALLAKVKKAGDLDRSTATMEEIATISEERAMPSKSSSVLDVKNLQISYTKQASVLDATKAQKVVFLTARYDKALEGLQKRLVSSDKFDEAKAVQAERKSVVASEAYIEAKAIIAQASKNSSAPMPVAAHTGKKSLMAMKKYTIDRKGGTGLVNSGNNYVFDLEEIGQKTELHSWLTYDSAYGGTLGDVVLTNPSNVSSVVFTWSDKNIHNTNGETGKSLAKPVVIDISKYIEEPGQYQVLYRYKGGGSATEILKAMITTK